MRAFWHLAEFGTPGSVYNVVRGESISIAEVLSIFLDLARVRPIETKSYPAEQERSSVREQWISNARLLALGWKPEETLLEAVRDQLDAERKRA